MKKYTKRKNGIEEKEELIPEELREVEEKWEMYSHHKTIWRKELKELEESEEFKRLRELKVNSNTPQWQEYFKDKSPEEIEKIKKVFEEKKTKKNFLRAAKGLQRVKKETQEKLSNQEAIDIGGEWLAYFEEEFAGLSWDSGHIIYLLKFEYDTAFIHLPQVISFFSEKIKSLFGNKPEELQIKEGENVFSKIKRINRKLREEEDEGRKVGRYLIKVLAFDNVQFYSLDGKETCDMPWDTFFVELPKALATMKEQYEKIVGCEVIRDMSEEAEEEIEKTPGRKVIPEAVRIAVWRRDEGKCAKCGSRENLEYDHIIPISKGGSNTVRNIELLCEECNRKKRDNIE